jgi:predicted metal-dependent phosphoesterase TrpH
MTSRAALDCINAAGGLPVLAHYSAAARQKELINLLLEWGLRGLEVFYRRFLDDEINELYELTTKLPLVATGGSDYHGDGATYAQWQVSTYVPRKVADKLLEAIG